MEGRVPALGHGRVLHILTPPHADLITSLKTQTHFCLDIEFALVLIWGDDAVSSAQPLISTRTGTHTHTTLPDSITRLLKTSWKSLDSDQLFFSYMRVL